MSKPGTTSRTPGRPTAYRNAFSDKAAELFSEGATDREVARALGIAESTLYLWEKRHAEFSEARKRGKAVADQKVEQSLFKRAVGFIAPDIVVTNYQGRVTITPIEKHYPPDPVSMIFWLKNRKPREWRDRVEVKEEIETRQQVSQEVIELARKLAREL